MAIKRIPGTVAAFSILGVVGATILTLVIGGLWLLNQAGTSILGG